MSRHLDVNDAVVAAMNDHAFSLQVAAVCKVLPLGRREDFDELVVSVMPSAFSIATASRQQKQARYSVDVAVQKAVDPDDLVAFDSLFALLEEITDLFIAKRLAALPLAFCVGVETVPGAEAGFAVEHLAELRVFTGVLRLTFSVIEP